MRPANKGIGLFFVVKLKSRHDVLKALHVSGRLVAFIVVILFGVNTALPMVVRQLSDFANFGHFVAGSGHGLVIHPKASSGQ